MKKIIYAILISIIIAGSVIIGTIGLKADIIFSKNAQIDVLVGETFNFEEIKTIVKEVFTDERIVVQEIELFEDMFSITLEDRTDEELKEKIETLNTKINEKYGTDNKAEDIKISHNPKTRLLEIIKPYVMPISISVIFILIFVAIRYKKLGIIKTLASYILSIGAVEAIFLSSIAITRFPINRLVIPIGLLLYVIVITVLGFMNEKKIRKVVVDTKKEKINNK